jgi:O-succinylbenzoate synthase
VISERRGWLLRLERADGAVGWGEAGPLDGQLDPLQRAIDQLGSGCDVAALERLLAAGCLPGPLAFALGSALAELQGLPLRRWLAAPPPARLLPAGPAALERLAVLLVECGHGSGPGSTAPLTVKWKVAVCPDDQERSLLERLLQLLPVQGRLRLDANGGWDRPTAWRWAERLAAEPRLEWLEQPLPPGDPAGLAELAARLPVALDESLQGDRRLAGRWTGWQVRRPSQEGDPRPLLAALEAGQPRLVLSTAFETGIGGRWLGHLAALQGEGPTPAAPGLAPAWQPTGELASGDPEQVWEAAG